MSQKTKVPKLAKNSRLPVFGKCEEPIPDFDWDFLDPMTADNYTPPKPDLARWRGCISTEHIAVRASLFQGRPRQPAALIKLLKGDGQPELIGPIKEALSAMREWQGSANGGDRTEKISVHRVLSHIWANDRLLSIFQKHFVDRTEPPPIRVTEIRIFGKSFYDLEDGNHRTEAAKMLGQKTILAEIGGTSCVNPKLWRIAPGGLENQTTGETNPRDADALAAAAWLGIKTKKPERKACVARPTGANSR